MEKQKILLVDDNPSLLKLGIAIFESGDYDVVTASDGLNALGVLVHDTIDLVITDILMPNMDGYSLCHSIRNNEQHAHIPIIVYSATYISQSDEELALEIGADLFIRKPASMNFLLAAAKELISRPMKQGKKGNLEHELSHVKQLYSHKLILKLEENNIELEKTQAETIKKQEQIEFDQNNLDALINNTSDLMWSVDRNYKLITANKAFDEIMMHMTGKSMANGSNVFASSVSAERSAKYKKLYDRAFSGEIFKITEYNAVPVVFWSELSFYPIRKGDEVIGTACYSHNITDNKIAEEKIKKSEANLKVIFENASDAFILTDNKGNIVAFNNNACKTLQLTCPSEIEIGRNMIEYAVESRKHIFADMLTEVQAGIPVQYEQSFINLSGRELCFEFTITPVEEGGIINNICFNGRDITEQRRITEKIKLNEKRLEAEREKFADLFLQAPSCICILKGPEHVFEMTNPLYLEFTGKKDIVGKTATEVFPEVAQQGFLALLNNVYKTGEPVSGREVLIQVDRDDNGVLIDYYMDFVYQPYRNANGEIDGIFFFANIVTEQVLARMKIEQNEKYFRALVENAGDLITVTDKTGKLTYASPALGKLTGCTTEKVTGMSLFSFQHPENVLESKQRFNELLRRPAVPTFRSSRFLRADGTYVWVEGTVTNLLDDKDVQGIVGNFRDVTEHKLYEERLIKANRLYAFISQVNQTIVHVKNEQTLFKEACRIAIEFGKFKMAWVGIIDTGNKKISLTESCGILNEDIPLFVDSAYDSNGPQTHVLENGVPFFCNDIESELKLPGWKVYAAKRGLRSFIVLPIRRSGEIVGTLNFYASGKNMFDEQEISLLEEAAGDISFALGVFEKEKHRKQMEEKVTHSASSLSIAQSIGHLGSWENDFSTGLTSWSDEHCRIFGLSPDENIQTYESWLSYIHPDDLEYVLKMIKEGYDSLKTSIYDHRIVLKDGSVKFIHTETHFKFNGDGKPIGLYGIALDVTVQKESEKALELSEANMRLFMNLIPQAIFAKDYYGNFIFTNKSFGDLYGLTPQQLINKTVTETIPVKADAEAYLEQDREVILSGQTKTIPEQNFTDHRGRKRILHTIKVPYTVASTNGKAVLGITMDITDDKIAETERLKMIADIVQRNQDLEQFSYIISHNLRAPVANILGLVGIMETGIDKVEEKTVTNYLSIAAKNLDDVIMDLNTILELKHKVNEKKEFVKFAELLGQIKVSLNLAIKDQIASVNGDFSAIDGIVSLRSYLYSIFLNIISNSIKYRRQGIYPVIEITSSIVNNKIRIIFKDNGMGIDLEQNRQYLFGLYKRFHSHVDGKGMGLYMVKTQVESLGGTISVSSEVNKGTEFVLEFDHG